jgi:glucokinase
MILAGDIGGTNTRLAFFKIDGKRLTAAVEGVFASRDHKSLEEIVAAFVSQHGLPVEHACIGVAGPVRNGRCEGVNLPWVVDGRQLAALLGLKAVGLINDLEATGYGISALEASDFIVLNEGAPGASGNAAIIAAGTGLGEAGLYWNGADYLPIASEGGHADFAPRNALEIELLRYLQARFTHVSWERVLSGPGLFNIYKFLRDAGRGEEPDWLANAIRDRDAAAVISEAALEGRSPLCAQALDLFVSFYGAEAGNLALKFLAAGGIFVGGGIAPRIIEKLKDSTFMSAFISKGRLNSLLEAIPVRVILNDKAALLGAARCVALRARLL